jgi:tetratricopeptide (TPR) repeat protein
MTTASGQTVGLAMIVRNESRVVRRCLESVRGLVDRWTVVDTGSTDGTQALVRKAMSGLRGSLVERPWVDFGHNRTELLELARPHSDYVLVIDADEVMSVPAGFSLPELTDDAYMTVHEAAGTRFYLAQLLRSSSPWRYEGVVHEVAACDAPHKVGKVHGLVCRGMFDSFRNRDPEKYAKDAALLEAAVGRDPDNARNAFYLAQSYRDSGQFLKAADAYQRRASMGGWDEEVWYSVFQAGVMYERVGRLAESALSHMRAYQLRPSRAEPVCELARRFREAGDHHVAHLFASAAAPIPAPDDILFMDPDVYEWRALDELSISAFYVGRYEESIAALDRLLERAVPESEVPRMRSNRRFSEEKLGLEPRFPDTPALPKKPARRKR